VRHFTFQEAGIMNGLFFQTNGSMEASVASLRSLLAGLEQPFSDGDAVGVKPHWGERGNRSFLPPVYAREIGGDGCRGMAMH